MTGRSSGQERLLQKIVGGRLIPHDLNQPPAHGRTAPTTGCEERDAPLNGAGVLC